MKRLLGWDWKGDAGFGRFLDMGTLFERVHVRELEIRAEAWVLSAGSPPPFWPMTIQVPPPR